ncbi:lytic transglycosylase [Hylemonella gracilis str. Niagara R]|uniref:Lytic transglycosylase n=1 Tax=Hylemonella gracilis str. Niagara R TaxID=1458275 RepID=A0A016XJN2_9BURK|nr:murein transglycosylase domain-containing protein [Hylemonella gracilis]EYC52026.1 lytic transglycosylase [Hylemonella gracilis str. Niagara R]
MNRQRRLLLGAAGSTGATLALSACSTQQALNIAMAKDPKAALQNIAENRVESYKTNPELLVADIKRAQAEYNKLMDALRRNSGRQWGEREAGTLPSRTRYVKYTDDYKSRAVVDYDAGTLLIEHLDDPQVIDKLRRATIVALLTPSDPGAVDLFSDKEVVLSGTPYLQGLVVDQNNAVIDTRGEAETYARWLSSHSVQQRQIDVNGKNKTVHFVLMKMVNASIDKRALRYASIVRKHSDKNQVSRSLIYAIIRIESAFNPYAVSSAPAYGMMQLVPSSGGRDAYRRSRGEDVMPSKEFLFVPENNIELGAAYLGLLLHDSPLNDIRDPLAREYCAIAAYNTGTGNVYRAFSDKTGKARQDEAIDRINALRADAVYNTLRLKLPYEETRGYIVKAVQAKKSYTAM